jgi:tetratricopeptide (TPR) repeat protein
MITGASEKERRQKILLSDRLQLRAREYEKSGEIYEALLCWQILTILNPSDREYMDKFQRLRLESRQRANRYFESGVLYFKKKEYQSARKEFLSALRYNPDHIESLEYLKSKMSTEIFQLYQIRKQDSLRQISKAFYQDPNKDVLIAIYNDLDPKQELVVGNYLRLPALEPGLTRPTIDVTSELDKARNLFLNRDYESAVRRTDLILRIDPSNGKAAELKNAALYQIAETYRKLQNYVETLKTLKKLDPRYKGVKKDIEEVIILLRQQAEENYRLGVNFFVNEEFNKAIERWQDTLKQNPQHPKARQDIEKARRLLKKLDEVD